MLKYHGIIYFFFLSLFACERNQKVDLTGSLEVKSPFYFDLYEMESGSKVIADTLYSDTFKIKLDKLPKGIYQIVFSWERDVVKPQEIERFARQPELGTPSTYQQAELEELLLAKNRGESIKMAVVSDGKNNKVYNEYLALLDQYKAENRHLKDSLQQVAVHYNDLKLFEGSERLNALLVKDWLPNVKTALLREEINFMKDNIDSEVIPHIYHIQVNTKEDFEQYREIYNLFPLSVKQNFTVWNKSN